MLREVVADATAALHLAYFVGVVAGLLCIAFGPPHWTWTRNLWLRLAHALAIAIVVVENAGAWACPLNVIEDGLRTSSSGARQTATGTGYLLDQLLYHVLSGRVLEILWLAFAVAAVTLFVTKPPRLRSVERRRA